MAYLTIKEPRDKNKVVLDLILPGREKYRADVLLEHPHLSQFLDLNGMCGYDWCIVLQSHPHFEQLCTEHNGWDKMDGLQWFKLLKHQPTFVSKCEEYRYNVWEKRTSWHGSI